MRKINMFWNWFQDNNQMIKNSINEPIKIQNQINNLMKHRLGFYNKEIDFIIVFLKKNNSKTELIISANGNPEHYDCVNKLIKYAPALKYWKFSAFTQSNEEIKKKISPIEESNVLQEITLKNDSTNFLAIKEIEKESQVITIIHMKNCNVLCSTKTYQQALFLIITSFENDTEKANEISFIQSTILNNDNIKSINIFEFQYYIELLSKNKML